MDTSAPVTVVQRVSVLVAAMAAVGASLLQATGALGLTPAEFAATGASTVRAASYAFGIWGLIYAGLLAYAAYQMVPGWASTAVLRRFGWPSAVSMLAIGLWLVAAGANWRWATVGLMLVALVPLLITLATPPGPMPTRDRLLVVAPLALLAGWLTIAAGLNTVTVLTAEGIISDTTATWWAVGGLTASVGVALSVLAGGCVPEYPLPVVWGLIAVFVAERGDRPPVAWYALGSAVLLLMMVPVLRTRCRRSGAVPPPALGSPA